MIVFESSTISYTKDQVDRIRALLNEWPEDKREDVLFLIHQISERPDFWNPEGNKDTLDILPE